MPKVVFVTGASRGIGRGVAKRFLCEGYKVALGYKQNRVMAEELAKSYPDKALVVQIDQGCRESIRSAIAQTVTTFGGQIDILVNNGAVAQEKSFLTIDDQDWDDMLATNLRGPFALIQEVLPGMISGGWGRIVNMTSLGGQWGGMNQVHYAAAKAGLINLTRSMAKLYSMEGITCNAVSPGLVETDMVANELETPDGKEKVKHIPAGRLGSIEEIASSVFYLCSEEAGYITGQTINLNGGMYFG